MAARRPRSRATAARIGALSSAAPSTGRSRCATDTRLTDSSNGKALPTISSQKPGIRCKDHSTHITTNRMVARTDRVRGLSRRGGAPAAGSPAGRRQIVSSARPSRNTPGDIAQQLEARRRNAQRPQQAQRNPGEGDHGDGDDDAPLPELRRRVGHRDDAEPRRAAAARRQQETADDARQPYAQERHQIAEHDLAQQRRPGEAEKRPDAADGEGQRPAGRRTPAAPSSRAAGRRRW